MTIYVNLPDEPEPVPITNLFDSECEETDDWDEAVTFVAGPLANGKWFAADTADLRLTYVH